MGKGQGGPRAASRESSTLRVLRLFVFVFLNVAIVGGYCFAMVGKLEPLKHEPERFVLLPLMLITAAVAFCLHPILRRQRSCLNEVLFLYGGFVFIAVLYGIFLWIQFPDGKPGGILLALVGAHLYGSPVFLAVLAAHFLARRWLLRADRSRA